MSNARRVPTRIIDRNGKATTVHRRADDAAATTGTGRAIPSPAAPAPTQQNPQRTAFKLRSWIIDLIAKNSPNGERPDPSGTVDITDEEAFAYLRFGVDLRVAAAMHSAHPDPSHWEHTKAARRLAARGGPLNQIPAVADSVEIMRSIGCSPAEVSRMLDNGLADVHLRRAITPEQTAVLFAKVNCRANKSTDDGSKDLARYLTDGTLPITLVTDADYSRETLLALTRLATGSLPTNLSARPGGILDGFHSAAKADPDIWRAMAELVEHDPANRVETSYMWQALRAFGEADTRRFGHRLLLRKSDTGGRMGDVVRAARALGMDDDAIEAAINGHGGRGSAVLAIARGDVVPGVSEGWL